VVGAGLAVWALSGDGGNSPLAIAFALTLGGLGCGLAALRVPGGDRGEERAAAARVFLGACALAGVWCAVAFAELVGDSELHRVWATAAPEERLRMAWSSRATTETASLMGLVAVLATLTLALIPAAPLLRRLRSTRTLVSGALAAALLLPVGGVRLISSLAFDEVRACSVLTLMQELPDHLDDLPHAGLPEGLEPTWLEDRTRGTTLDWSTDGWQFVHPVNDEPTTLPVGPGRGPSLLVPADAPAAALLAEAIDRDGLVDVVLRLDPAAPTTIEGWPTGLVSLGLELVPRGQQVQDLVLERGTFDPTEQRLQIIEGSVDDPVASLRELDASNWRQVALVPGERWTVQDVVTLCLVVRSLAGHDGEGEGGRWVRCTLAAEGLGHPIPPPEVPAREQPEDPELIDGPGGLGQVAGPGGLGALAAPERPPADPEPIRARVQVPPIETDDREYQEAISRTMRRYAGRFEQCYERQLRVQPTLNGKVVLEFDIEPSGRVSNARISSSSMADPELDACLVQAIERARFPVSDGETVSISYPLIFNAE